MVWKFLAAANEKFIPVQSQLESAWPVIGSVMVDGDGIVVTAGRQSATDGGIRIYKLRPRDGHILWQTKLWHDPDRKIDPEVDRAQWAATRNRRVNELLVHNGKQVCLWITPLKESYETGELVDTEKSVFAARAMRFSVQSKEELRELTGATWIRSGSSNGLLSRRVEGVGRHDEDGVRYAQLNGKKICLAGHEGDSMSRFIYALQANAGRNKNLSGGLLRAALNADGTLPDTAEMTNRSPKDGIYNAMIVAGSRIYITYAHPHSGEAMLLVYSAESGEPVAEHSLPAPVVRDGLAAAYGRLYLSCEDGSLLCLGR